MRDETEDGLQNSIVVGVGASAGGLEAFQSFLTGLPEAHDMVIVLIQHLDPDHDSLMPELIAAKTASPVHSARDGMQVEPGHIYLIPPGYEMRIEGGELHLTAYEAPRGLRRPIDVFFKSLAQECGENAVAVVLSGTGSDGTDGAREVKLAGGLVFVQDPKQAKYDGMPQSVLDQGGADIVSLAEEVVEVIGDYFNLRKGSGIDLSDDDEFLGRILRHVRFRTGHDFADYKTGTMLRRIAVRMSVLNISEPGEYLKYIAENKEESDLLFRDLLINVTSFFRDDKHFEILRREVIPELIEGCDEHGEIRVWSAGCSSGEEAYSVGIFLAEEASRLDKRCKIVVFGTDIDEAALNTARAGKYNDSISSDIPDDLLERYFRPTSEGFEVGSELREMVRFSRHSFVKDPPFSKLDLVICRNVLIYFKENLQETAVRVFHYALKEGGHLFIGPSENPLPVHDYFAEVSSKARIFRRRPGAAKPLNLGALSGAASLPRVSLEAPAGRMAEPDELFRHVLERHAPAHIHVSRSGEVLYTSDGAARYLRVRGGRVSSDITSLILPELDATVRRALRLGEASQQGAEIEYQGEVNGREERLVIASERLPDGSILLVIHDNLMLREDRVSLGDATHQDHYIRQLEGELDQAKQEVRTTVEELETSNEELKSSNEEMMSMNEELQSANEELTTINDELQQKLRALNQANADLKNFTESTRVATVFLDGGLVLVNFTPEAEDYFSFTKADIGRDISDLNSVLDDSALLRMCQHVLQTGQEAEQVFETEDGKTNLLVRVMTYHASDTGNIGVVFTLQDVSDLQDAIERAEEATRIAEAARDEVEQIYKNSPMAMALIDKDYRYLRMNDQLALINGEATERTIGATIRETIPDVADATEALIDQVLATGEAVRGQQVTGTIKSAPDDVRVWESDWVPYRLNGELSAVAVTVRDITDQVEMGESLKRVMRELEHRVKNMLGNVSALINQAKREVTEGKDVYEKLTQRINALAKTHALLTAAQWSSAPLGDIIEPETAAVYGEDRVQLEGPNIRVNAQATLAIGMAIHELATNAAKYGAFSVENGHVHVRWSRLNDARGDRLILTWKESGGPRPDAPEAKGFGSQLIRAAIEANLGGTTTSAWEEDGLRFDMEVDFEDVTNIGDSDFLSHEKIQKAIGRQGAAPS